MSIRSLENLTIFNRTNLDPIDFFFALTELDHAILERVMKIEAVVVLYYFPLNPYLTLRKHMGQDAADEYQDEMAAFTDGHSPVT